MKISPAEQAAIREVCRLGAIWGYGNLISHLQSAWTRMLMDEYGLSEEQANQGGYPIQMHVDLLESGKWDETGKRYREANTDD